MATGFNDNREEAEIDSGISKDIDDNFDAKDQKLGADSATASCFDPSLNNIMLQNFALVNGNNKLMLAIAANKPAEIFIDNAPESKYLDLTNESGQTAMITAALQKQHSCIRRLLLAGANPNVQDAEGKTALHYSVLNDDLNSLKALTAEVTETEINAYFKHCPSRFLGVIKTEMNIRDRAGRTPLHLAVQQQNAAMVKALLLAGADVNSVLSEDLRQNGVLFSGYDCLFLLTNAKLGKSLDDTSNINFDCFKYYEYESNIVLALGRLTISVDANEQQPATTSSSSQSHQAARKSKQSEIDGNEESGFCDTFGEVKGNVPFVNRYSEICMAPEQYYEIDSNGSSVLMIAVAISNVAAEYLIDNAPDVSYLDGCNYQRVSPIHVAAKFGNYLAVRRLRFAGANPNLRDFDGNTAVHYAIKQGDIKTLSELLVDANSDSFFSKCPHRKVPLIEVDLNIRNYNDETPLLLAVKLEKLDVIKQLVKRGADPNIAMRSCGYTPLHLAAERGNQGIVDVLVKQCNTTRVNQLSSAGYTALDVAKSRVKRNEEILSLLESLDDPMDDDDYLDVEGEEDF